MALSSYSQKPLDYIMRAEGAQVENLKTIMSSKDKRQKTKAFVNNSDQKTEAIKCDIAIEDFNDLIDPRFKNWFCKCYYALGEDVMRKIASESRSEASKSSKNLFGWSVKKEMIKRGL